MTSESWLVEKCDELVDSVRKLLDEVVLDDPRVDSPLRQVEAIRKATRIQAIASLVEVETSDPAYPHITANTSVQMNWAFNNPDCNYDYATIHGDYSYRIFGRRGTEHMFDVEVWEGSLGHTEGIRSITGAYQFEYGPNGEYEIFLSRNERTGNWLPTPEGLGFVLVRQISYDWEGEEPSTVFIERVGAAYPPPAPTPEVLLGRLGMYTDFIREVASFDRKGVDLHHYSLPDNSLRFRPITLDLEDRGDKNHFAYRDLSMGQGRYRFGADEAVILELDAARADYWNVYLMSHFWETVDPHERQSSLNGAQARLDSDGVFRGVISLRDPGVQNWLDPAGHTSGLVIARYILPDVVPEARLTVVPFDKVRELLPADTPAVSPDERNQTIRSRMIGMRKRRRDF